MCIEIVRVPSQVPINALIVHVGTGRKLSGLATYRDLARGQVTSPSSCGSIRGRWSGHSTQAEVNHIGLHGLRSDAEATAIHHRDSRWADFRWCGGRENLVSTKPRFPPLAPVATSCSRWVCAWILPRLPRCTATQRRIGKSVTPPCIVVAKVVKS